VSALVDEFQGFSRFHRLEKRPFLLKTHCLFSESWVSRLRESCESVKIGFTFTGNGGPRGEVGIHDHPPRFRERVGRFERRGFN
jgi:hypothetical protein